MKFLDQAKIYLQQRRRRRRRGRRSGARNSSSIGGPDGGDGGRGGDLVDRGRGQPQHAHRLSLSAAFPRRERPSRHGRQPHAARPAKAWCCASPSAREILADDKETLLLDLTRAGERHVLLRGGDGGFGNAHYKSSTNRAPRRAGPGWPGEERWVWLRLKLIADAGLVGQPNAGKSTFLAAVSRARPKVADYPFTTLRPQLGVVHVHDTEFVLADLPGLIEGASEGAGLGHRFLAHVERCAVLLHLVDATQEDVVGAWRTIRAELATYGHALAQKPEILALSKSDALDARTLSQKRAKLQRAARRPVLTLSGVSRRRRARGMAALLAGIEKTRAAEARAPAFAQDAIA